MFQSTCKCVYQPKNGKMRIRIFKNINRPYHYINGSVWYNENDEQKILNSIFKQVSYYIYNKNFE